MTRENAKLARGLVHTWGLDKVTDPKEWGGNVHRGAKATGKVSRADFGLKWNTALEKGGVVVGDEVTLSINAELIKAAPAAAKK